MSVRSLNRRFKEQTGTTPLQWLLRAQHRAPGQSARWAAGVMPSVTTAAPRASSKSAVARPNTVRPDVVGWRRDSAPQRPRAAVLSSNPAMLVLCLECGSSMIAVPLIWIFDKIQLRIDS